MYYHTSYVILSTFFPAPSTYNPEPLTSFQALGIRSDHEAAELERDLGVRFDDFTPEDCETWILQTVYLEQFSKTRVVSFAADDAGVTIRTARQWQADNILGFSQRLEIAVLRYTDVLEVMLFQRAQEPDSPPSLLMMLLRAHMPEKYGSARRSSTPRDDNACSHDRDPHSTTTSQYDQELLEAIFQDLQNLKQFTGLTEPDPTPEGAGFNPAHDLSPAGEENTAHSHLSPAGEENTAHSHLSPAGEENTAHSHLSPAGEENTAHSHLSPAGGENTASHLSPAGGETQRGGVPTLNDHAPTEETCPTTGDHLTAVDQGKQSGYVPAPSTQRLNRRQRRELQRGANRQKSHLARAPN